MKLIKNREIHNDFTIKGLTLANLYAIQNALEADKSWSIVGENVKIFLQRELPQYTVQEL